jgi:shikimate dehydrogenase
MSITVTCKRRSSGRQYNSNCRQSCGCLCDRRGRICPFAAQTTAAFSQRFSGHARCRGAARSIAYALARLQVARLAIINRTYSRAESLARFVRERFQLPDTKALPEGEQLEGLSSADIVINTTSVGMYPYTSESLVKDPRVFHNGQLVYDLIYNPSATRLLHDARRNGAEIQNGLDMLIYQGLVSLNIWRQDTYELRAADLQELRQVLTQELAAHE